MIALSLQEIEFMLIALPLPPYLGDALMQLKHKTDKIISDDMADELRDLCTEKLDTHGFDINYIPTKEGEILESLIDKLFIG